MNKIRTIGIIFSMFALLGLNSCDDDDIDSPGSAIIGPGTVHTRISASGSSTSLEAALKIATGDLPGTLEGTGPFTVFAPNNTAFANLAESLGFESTDDVSASEALLASIDPALLSQILTYHVVAGSMEAASLSDGATLTTVLGDEISVIISEDGDIQLLDATKLPETSPVSTIVQSDGYAENGIVHFIDKVLLPQAAIDALDFDIRPTIIDWATGTDDLSLLASSIEKAGLTDAIAALDTARVLAPNNQAFADLLETLGDDYNSLDDFDNEVEIALLGEILLYHVLPPVDDSIDLTVGPATTLLDENFVDVTTAVGGFAFGDATADIANTITADIDAKNGAVDIIDKVLLPQAALDFSTLLDSDDLATTVTGAPQLSVLEEALIATDLAGAFVDMTNVQDDEATNFTYYRPATVFAPTDAAFEDLFNALGPDYTSIASFDTEEELALLSEILLYHVLAGKVVSEDLEAGVATTASEKDIEIISVVGTDNFVIGDATNDVNANITTPDVLARNGVAHIIDKVLLPKSAIDFIESME
ncbi:fasciclin domain-containing protein [Maribacter sp. ANRC-HE7]|uniref:Fasciclin domain-containing protein n=1 Tax=Maribacter aquimaris TaxID=2737171 RepID=A0ABR7V1U8_9FLAO|nr:fasciclin domain-containing protein [Maribacter aquimaris]MBD0778800.1 fasciclin domain-containing protein [Maribacter aquimaris]